MNVRLLLLLLIGLKLLPVHAQSSAVVVPDLAGLNLPQAAASLNSAGLNLGVQTLLLWTAESGLPQNSVSAQSVPAGSSVEAGITVDVTILRSPNMQLIYDDNDLTLVNMTDSTVDLRRMSFAASGNAAFFTATRLANDLRSRQCVQVWSIGRNGSKGLPECEFIQNWLSTNNRNEHFWTALNGVSDFAILDNGVELVRCPAAPAGSEANPLRCDFYYAGTAEGSEMTEYLYFAYTTEAVAIINRSEDRWMPTNLKEIYNYNPSIMIPGSPLRFGDPQLFREEFRRGPGNVEMLAPGQCIVLTSFPSTENAPPQPCQVVAQRDLDPSVAFWVADFEVQSLSTGRRLNCPAALADRPTLCILSR